MPTKKDAVSVTRIVSYAVSPLLGSLVDAFTALSDRSDKVTESGGLDELRTEAERQELAARMAESQARIAQEIAIARRIETATEVEIEEFYDTAGDGSLGVTGSEKGVTIGASGSGRRVSRRVYRFTGHANSELPEAQ